MRFCSIDPVYPTQETLSLSQSDEPVQGVVEFARDEGTERVQLYILDNTIIRVIYLPDGKERLDRTWMVINEEGNIPLSGAKRSDVPSSFPRPKFSIKCIPSQERDGSIVIETDVIRITINYGSRFFIRWGEKGTDAHFASDVPGRSYCKNRTGTDVFHYMQRSEEEIIYGLGEKSGPLSKTNQRFIMKNVDALGYNAKSSDPLYKHWPFYYCFNKNTQCTYGLFYDNQSTSVFDMGKEIDAYHGPFRYYQAENGDIDYYFIYGPTMKNVLHQ
jgi:alpha-glucosidase